MMELLLLLMTMTCAAAAPATFSSLTLVGERRSGGTTECGLWGPLDAESHISDPASTRKLKRGDPNAQLIQSPRQSPDLLRQSATTVLCTANDTVSASTDAGRSWVRGSSCPAAGYITNSPAVTYRRRRGCGRTSLP
jgi:hypothetical protein